MKRLLLLIAALLISLGFSLNGVAASSELLDYCLEPYQPVIVQAIGPPEDGVIFSAYAGAGGETIQVYLTLATGAVEFYVNGNQQLCSLPVSPGDLPTITLYPLGGQRWTWAVQDEYGHWHTVRDQGAIVVTPLEYDDQGRAMTRLVINRDEPIEPSRWSIFDENGNTAG